MGQTGCATSMETHVETKPTCIARLHLGAQLGWVIPVGLAKVRTIKNRCHLGPQLTTGSKTDAPPTPRWR
eukprot:8698477-Alexandrium_andersonii.AAC.1